MGLIKSKEEIQIMREGGRILASIMKEIKNNIRPGVSGKYLDKVAEDLVFKYKVKPSFKNYKGFPAALCVSINEEIVHGIPSEEEIKSGDIVSIDFGIMYKGYHSDMALTSPVGNVSPEVLRLIRTTKKALRRGISRVKPGNTLGDVGNAIEKYIEGRGFKVIRDLCGHGIGKEIHEEPDVLNYGKKKKGEKIKEGMVLCLEPMASLGSSEIKKAKDRYGYETLDGSFSAHFEHTVIVRKLGAEVVTEL